MRQLSNLQLDRSLSVNNLFYSYDENLKILPFSRPARDSQGQPIEDNQGNPVIDYAFYESTVAKLTGQSAFSQALSIWDDYTNINIQAAGSGDTPNFVVFHANTNPDNNPNTPDNLPPNTMGPNAAYADFRNYDSASKTYDGAEIVIDDDITIQAGANSGFKTALHEIGHALGLAGDDALEDGDGILEAGEYDTDMSVMSYLIAGGGTRFAVTPMAYDIAALEDKYNYTVQGHLNSTTYDDIFTGANHSSTIIDSSGAADVFDLSAVAGTHRIDLREAIDSSDQWTNAPTIVNGAQYVYLARGSVIENAIGGAGNDTIIGNDVANSLIGGAGADSIWGNAGADTLEGGAGDDVLLGGSGNDVYVINPGDGDDVIVDSDGQGSIRIGTAVLSGTLTYDEASDSWDAGNGATFRQQGSDMVLKLPMAAGGGDGGGVTFKDAVADPSAPQSGPVMGVSFEAKPEEDEDEDGNPDDGGWNNTIPGAIYSPVLEGAANIYEQIMGTSRAPLSPGRDPLILDMDGDGLELLAMENSNVYFDLNSDGIQERSGWVGPDDALLAYDRNGNGTIDNVSELFGNPTTPGFDELAGYDIPANGVIDSGDALFADLQLWHDLNSDGLTGSGELTSLSAAGITSLSLNSVEVDYLSEGNRVARSASYTKSDGTYGEVGEVYFTVDFFDAIQLDPSAGTFYGTDTALLNLPQMRGYGQVASLQASMAGNATLKTMVENLATFDIATNGITGFRDAVADMVVEWAGETNNTDNRGAVFDGKKLAVLEAFFDRPFVGVDGRTDPEGADGSALERVWDDLTTLFASRVAVQGPLANLFPNASYNFTYDRLEINDNAEDILTRFDTGGYSDSLEMLFFLKEALDPYKTELAGSASIYEALFAERFGILVGADDMVDLSGLADGKLLWQGNEQSEFYQSEPVGGWFLKGMGGDDHLEEAQNGYFESLLVGGEGADTLRARHGSDVYIGGAGNDSISEFNADASHQTGSTNLGSYAYGGDGQDKITLRHGKDYLSGGAGDDILIAYGSNNTLSGGDGVDQLTASGTTDDRNNFLDGGMNNDVIRNYGSAGQNYGREGNDRFYLRNDEHTVFGGEGDDWLTVERPSPIPFSRQLFVEMEEGNDFVTGRIYDSVVNTGDGNDSLSGLISDNTTVNMGSGNDLLGSFNNPGDSGGFLHMSNSALLLGAGNDIANIQSSFANTIDGGDGDDFIRLDQNGHELIAGGAGADTIIGSGGSDTISGGSEADVFRYLLGSDSAFQSNFDVITDFLPGEGDKLDISELGTFDFLGTGSFSATPNEVRYEVDGNNVHLLINLYGNSQADMGIYLEGIQSISDADIIGAFTPVPTVTGTSSADSLSGSADSEILWGLEGNDTLNADAGDDTLNGGEGDDLLLAGTGNDVLNGDNGNDVLDGSSGMDVLLGGLGNDTLTGSQGADTVDGGDGTDWANYIYSNAGLSIDLLTSIHAGFAVEGDSFASIEIFALSNYDDSFIGDAGANTVKAFNGNDTLDGGDGDDVLEGWYGSDSILGGEGNDTIIAGTDASSNDLADYADGGNGNDSLVGGNGADTLLGGAGADTLIGGVSADFLDGGEGDDVLQGTFGSDTLIGGNGSDKLTAGDWGINILTGGADTDTLTGGNNPDRFVYEALTDSSIGSEDTIIGFTQGQGDKINLTAFAGGGSFIGTNSFGSTAKEIRYEQAGGNTTIEYDHDGDGSADFAIELQGTINLATGDFILA